MSRSVVQLNCYIKHHRNCRSGIRNKAPAAICSPEIQNLCGACCGCFCFWALFISVHLQGPAAGVEYPAALQYGRSYRPSARSDGLPQRHLPSLHRWGCQPLRHPAAHESARCLVAVHVGHLDVHENQVILSVCRLLHLPDAISPSSADSTSKPASFRISTAISRFSSLSSTSRIFFPLKPPRSAAPACRQALHRTALPALCAAPRGTAAFRRRR